MFPPLYQTYKNMQAHAQVNNWAEPHENLTTFTIYIWLRRLYWSVLILPNPQHKYKNNNEGWWSVHNITLQISFLVLLVSSLFLVIVTNITSETVDQYENDITPEK